MPGIANLSDVDRDKATPLQPYLAYDEIMLGNPEPIVEFLDCLSF